MSRRALILLAAGGSAALLLGAFFFEALGYAPCRMCIWQRWPHAVAVAAGALGLALPMWGIVVGGAAALSTSAIGLYHSGVEQGWWDGPSSCTGSGLGGLSGSDLLSFDAPAPVMCDDITWAFAGLSMASWNAILSFALFALWIAAARRA